MMSEFVILKKKFSLKMGNNHRLLEVNSFNIDQSRKIVF
jgi:hypothetical protein